MRSSVLRRSASVSSAASVFGRSSAPMIATSRSSASATIRSAVEPTIHLRQPRRCGRPTRTRVMFWARAYSRTAVATSPPPTTTLLPPSDSARRSAPRVRSRSTSGSRNSAGVSTYSAVHSAWRPAARRRAARTRRAAKGPGRRSHQDPLRDRPGAGNAVLPPVLAHLGVDALRRRPQGELPQRDEVALPEEAAHRLAGLLGDVDLPVVESPDQIVGREIDQLDLRRLLEDRVGDGLADGDPGHPGDDVVQALEVLDVERRVDVDAGGQELLDVLPALGVPRARRVRVGQLVDEDERRVGARGRRRDRTRGSIVPRYSTARGGSRSSPGGSASVSARPWVSTMPMTTSVPRAFSARASDSIAYVLPTPAVAPRNILSFPRCARTSSRWTRASKASGSGRYSDIMEKCSAGARASYWRSLLALARGK